MAKLAPNYARLYAYRMATNPPRTARECSENLGIAIGTVSAQWSKIRSLLGHDPLQSYKELGLIGGDKTGEILAIRNVSADLLIKLNEMSQEKLLRRLHATIEQVSPDKIGGILRDLVNARALQKGEPTQILRVDQRDNLRKILPAMLKEAARRGVTIELGDGEARVMKNVKPIEAEAVVDVG